MDLSVIKSFLFIGTSTKIPVSHQWFNFEHFYATVTPGQYYLIYNFIDDAWRKRLELSSVASCIISHYIFIQLPLYWTQ